MAMRRIAMCEQAGTGMRMMREEWGNLGHPSPVYKNDRSRKAFELFIPGLDQEVDMASDLLKAMFAEKGPDEVVSEPNGNQVAGEVGAKQDKDRRQVTPEVRTRTESGIP
jgi:hypothetical protein